MSEHGQSKKLRRSADRQQMLCTMQHPLFTRKQKIFQAARPSEASHILQLNSWKPPPVTCERMMFGQ
ncbi:MAG: hypothetical protein QOE55_6935 [Acidobacteriaceae bacterium]|nr:hypothetical protein [Acidobacteriaceae bacterium]